MAVTTISKPDPNVVWSASYPMLITLSSDKVGQPGVTTHKFYNTITISGVVVGTVWYSSLAPPTVTFDISGVVKHSVRLPKQVNRQNLGTLVDLPVMAQQGLGDGWGVMNQRVEITNSVGERYIEGGITVTNAGETWSNSIDRGKSNSGASMWKNMIDEFGAGEYYYPFSSFDYFSFPINVKKFLPLTTDFNYTVRAYAGGNTYDFAGATISTGEAIFIDVIYLSLFEDITGTGGDKVDKLDITINDGATPLETFTLKQLQNICNEDDQPVISIMFQDRYYEWSFLQFPKKNYRQVTRESEEGYLQGEGMINYAVKARTRWRVNTDYLDESANWLFEDLLSTREAYRIGSVGYQQQGYERLRVVSSTWNEKTIRNEKLVQYTFELDEALDNFLP